MVFHAGVSRETLGFSGLHWVQMTTDERIDAIAVQLEVVAGMQSANARAIAANEKAIAILTERTIQAMDAISRLAPITDAHEDRISELEDGTSRN